MSWFANGAARKVHLSRSILVFIKWYLGIPHQNRQPSWTFLVLVTPDSVAVTEMLNKSTNIFEHMFIYCSFAYFFLQSSLAEWLNPRSWATVYYGVRSLHILGKISCEYDSFYISSFYKLSPFSVKIFNHPINWQQNFKWEEQNYVVQNEIDSLLFLVKSDNLSKVSKTII